MPRPSDGARRAIDVCPHCGNEAGLELSPSLRYRCRICGGPRVPITGADFVRSHRESRQLESARLARRAELLFGALWIVSGVIGGTSLLLTLLTLLLFSGLLTGWGGLLLAPALLLILSLWARRRTLGARASKDEALANAWSSVAHEVLEHGADEMTATELGNHMLTDEAHAEQLLARLNVDDQVRTRITDDGELTYSTRSARRVRISGEPEDTLLETLEDFEVAKAPRTKV